MSPFLKRGRWCVILNDKLYKFATEEEALDFLGEPKSDEEIVDEQGSLWNWGEKYSSREDDGV